MGTMDREWGVLGTEVNLYKDSDVPKLLELSIDTGATPNVNKFLNGTSVATSTTYSVNTSDEFSVGAAMEALTSSTVTLAK